MFLETLCFAVVMLALAAPGLVVALMNYLLAQPARNDVSGVAKSVAKLAAIRGKSQKV